MVELIKKNKKKSKQRNENGLKENGTTPAKSDIKAKKDLVNGEQKKDVKNHDLLNLRDVKKRLEIESDYVEELLSLVKIPASLLVNNDQINIADDAVTVNPKRTKKDRPDLFGSEENRAKTDTELRERFQKKMGQIQSQTNRKEKKEKKKEAHMTKQMKRAAKKKEKRAALKKSLIKVTQGKGNLRKGNLGSQFEGVVTKGDSGEDKQNVVFSKFDFVEPVKGTRAPRKNIDPKQALEKIKRSKEKLKSMQAKGLDDKVEVVESKIAWGNAMDKAQGVKVKDDVELLKKTIRRKASEKRKGEKLWKSQADHVTSKKEAKQKKRTDNMKKRKTDKKDKARKLQIKKGRFIPGLD